VRDLIQKPFDSITRHLKLFVVVDHVF
jgi:hypothetical protein